MTTLRWKPNFVIWLPLLLLSLLLAGCGQLDLAYGPLLRDVSVAPDLISPNADGDTDVTEIRYSLSRSANVSIYFVNDAGERFYFRQERRRSPGEYNVLWGGVVDETEVIQVDPQTTMQILSRVLPDGEYRWVIEAVEDDGHREEASGRITLQDAETEVPLFNNFAVVPQTFRPNQDGLRDDWVSVSYYLTKDVETVQVFLVDPANPAIRYFIAEGANLIEPNERGYHQLRYEGGVDLNAEPPPDGTYQIIAEARDLSGNRVQVISELTIEEGGKPRADVARGEIDWSGEMNRRVSLMLGETLCFRAVVVNEGTVPIRTSGPWPGEEYLYTENYNTLAVNNDERSWGQQAGVWRFGINYNSTGFDFPFRWAVGRQQDLERRIIDGEEQWYLMPGASGETSGCIRFNERPPLNVEIWWGGLIHQDVGIANNDIDRITVDVGIP
jgi:hypothetical protein